METILNFLPLTEEEQDLFRLAAPAAEHRFRPVDNMLNAGEPLPGDLEKATIVLGNMSPADVAAVPGLKWLQTWSAGVDPYLAPGVLSGGTVLTSAVGAYGQGVSEHMFAVLLSLCKRLPQYRDLQNQNRWEPLGRILTLVDSTVLVVGTGDLGSSFAKLVKAMGAHTVGLRRDPSKPAEGIDEIYAFDRLEEWLPRADVVALMVPHSPETDNLMDGRRIALMKPEAILLNGGRGSAVDCDALAAALASGHLWGAGLDVTRPEPLPEDHPLWQLPNCVITPHVAGGEYLSVTRSRVVDIVLENLRRYTAGEPLRNRMR